MHKVLQGVPEWITRYEWAMDYAKRMGGDIKLQCPVSFDRIGPTHKWVTDHEGHVARMIGVAMGSMRIWDKFDNNYNNVPIDESTKHSNGETVRETLKKAFAENFKQELIKRVEEENNNKHPVRRKPAVRKTHKVRKTLQKSRKPKTVSKRGGKKKR